MKHCFTITPQREASPLPFRYEALRLRSVLSENKTHCSLYGEMMRGERELLFPRKEAERRLRYSFPPVPHSLGDGGSLHFKKSEKLLIYFHLTLSGTELNKKRWFFRLPYIHCGKSETEFWQNGHSINDKIFQ